MAIQKLEKNQLTSINSKILVGDVVNRIKEIPDNSVHLIITSPPYGEIKKYGNRKGEIGHGQALNDYYQSLNKVWSECERILHPGCRMVVNIGDEFLRSTKNQIYQIIPHHSHITNNILSKTQFVYTGDIHWSKVTRTETNGGGKIMGSVYTPRDGHFFINREYIMTFKLKGNKPKVTDYQRKNSKFSLEERREWFKDTWYIPPKRQNSHIAMFPNELPERFIRMYSFINETVFDPFLGSGTTLAMAAKWRRQGVGCELGFGPDDSWKDLVIENISQYHVNGDELQFE